MPHSPSLALSPMHWTVEQKLLAVNSEAGGEPRCLEICHTRSHPPEAGGGVGHWPDEQQGDQGRGGDAQGPLDTEKGSDRARGAGKASGGVRTQQSPVGARRGGGEQPGDPEVPASASRAQCSWGAEGQEKAE